MVRVGDRIRVLRIIGQTSSIYNDELVGICGTVLRILPYLGPDNHPYIVELDGKPADFAFEKDEIGSCCEPVVLPKELFEI
jgi:sulfur carrier protein ThiS